LDTDRSSNTRQQALAYRLVLLLIYWHRTQDARSSALKEEIKSGAISISKATRIASVLKPENQNHWLDLAKTLQNTNGKQVAIANPKTAFRER